ncbi:COG5473 Predicted integral membrane protein [Comamonadaceae bacterium]
MGAPLQWLARGAKDLWAHPGIGLFYGLAFTAMALVLGAVFRSSPEYTMTMASGCLLVGPFLAMGTYEVSRRREAGLRPALGASILCWDRHVPSMAMLVLVLIVLELLWGRASLVVFAVFFNTGMPSTTGVVQAIFNPQNLEFVFAYSVVGGGFALLVFALTVVSIPMILDRDTDAISAAITSIEVFLKNMGVMILWGALLTGLLVGAMLLPWHLGLLIVGPWLGHATWYAYRGAVQWPASESPTAAIENPVAPA